MGKMKPQPQKRHHKGPFNTSILKRSWCSKKTFEIEFTRPPEFSFTPGQRIRFIYGPYERDYSLVSGADDSTLRICVRKVENGIFSPVLASVEEGHTFEFTGPHGYFTFHVTPRPPVFAATGTGIAPFVSMVKSGVSDFILLHGVSSLQDLPFMKHPG